MFLIEIYLTGHLIYDAKQEYLDTLDCQLRPKMEYVLDSHPFYWKTRFKRAKRDTLMFVSRKRLKQIVEHAKEYGILLD